MTLISLKEYANMHGVTPDTIRQKVLRGGFTTAQKIGRNWVIDKDEPYSDQRQKSVTSHLIDKVANTYKKTGSLKETAKIHHISEQKVRKLLITKGVYSTPLADKIANLHAQGLTSKEIEDKLKMSRAAVNSYLPYEKAIYGDQLSENARRIRKSRDRLKR